MLNVSFKNLPFEMHFKSCQVWRLIVLLFPAVGRFYRLLRIYLILKIYKGGHRNSFLHLNILGMATHKMFQMNPSLTS